MMQPGDHYLFIAIAYGVFPSPYNWVETKKEALAAIDWLEQNVPTPNYASDADFGYHLQFRWWDDLELAIRSLSATDANKEILLFAAEFPPDLSTNKLNELGTWTSASRAALSVVDVIAKSRVMPRSLSTVAANGGGRLYSNLQTARHVVAEPLESSSCRFQASFQVRENESRKETNRVKIVFSRPDFRKFRIAYPGAIENPHMVEKPEARLTNLFAVREEIRDGLTLKAEVLFDSEPGKETRRGDLLLYLGSTPDLSPADVADGIAIDALVWRAAKEGAKARQYGGLPRNYQITDRSLIEKVFRNQTVIRIPLSVPAGENIEMLAAAVPITNDRAVAHLYRSVKAPE